MTQSQYLGLGMQICLNKPKIIKAFVEENGSLSKVHQNIIWTSYPSIYNPNILIYGPHFSPQNKKQLTDME